jgi:hypothetical protein
MVVFCEMLGSAFLNPSLHLPGFTPTAIEAKPKSTEPQLEL